MPKPTTTPSSETNLQTLLRELLSSCPPGSSPQEIVNLIRPVLEEVDGPELERLLTDWRTFARPCQLAPQGNWTTWLFLGGRGTGKTRAGAEFIRESIKAGAGRVALVATNAADARDVMVEGDSGLLSVCSKYDRDHRGNLVGKPTYEPSKRRITWENGAIATTFSAETPDQLRGPQHHVAWADELVKWRYGVDTWDMMMFGLRLGANPRVVATTTPGGVKLLKNVMTDPDTVMTRGTTYDNIHFLAPTFIKQVVRKYEGTRLGRQELEAELLEDVPNALWQRSNLDLNRVKSVPDMKQLVVAIDPATTDTENSDEHGIVVAGKGDDDRGYVLEDVSLSGSPDQWAKKAIRAWASWKADHIIVETNNGGDMCVHTLNMTARDLFRSGELTEPTVPIKKVTASRGKVTRAEPVSALYEQNRISHLGTHSALEDQMCQFTSDFDRQAAGYSPDRVDALVWALSGLFLTRPEREFY